MTLKERIEELKKINRKLSGRNIVDQVKNEMKNLTLSEEEKEIFESELDACLVELEMVK